MDDIITFSKEVKEIDTVKQKLKKLHPMTDSRSVKRLLGIRFTWKKDGPIRLDQESYARHILEKFGMADCNRARSPITQVCQYIHMVIAHTCDGRTITCFGD